MSNELDTSLYTQLPTFDVAAGTALATALNSALQKGMPASVKKAAAEMMKAAEALSRAWRDEPTPSVDDRRPADLALDRAWGSFHGRLDAYTGLAADRYPQSARAAELINQLFPTGLSFLKLPYVQEWAESEKRLKQIAEGGLAKALNELAGPEFLKEIEQAHAVYGEVLGITKAGPATQAPVRAERLRDLRKAMNKYVFNVLSQMSDDDATMESVRAALQPIDEFRAGVQARRGNGGPADAPAPAPVVAPVAAPVAGPSPVATPGSIAPAPVAVPPAPTGNPS